MQYLSFFPPSNTIITYHCSTRNGALTQGLCIQSSGHIVEVQTSHATFDLERVCSKGSLKAPEEQASPCSEYPSFSPHHAQYAAVLLQILISSMARSLLKFFILVQPSPCSECPSIAPDPQSSPLFHPRQVP
eukprot:1146308-Pelagomonas_calceolata.AAC.8